MSNQHITESLQKARDFYARIDPEAGPVPSFDAVFMVFATVGSPRSRAAVGATEPPPKWLEEFVQSHVGQMVTIGQVLMMSGQMTASKAERNMVGKWLRAMGKVPKKIGGKQLFVL